MTSDVSSLLPSHRTPGSNSSHGKHIEMGSGWGPSEQRLALTGLLRDVWNRGKHENARPSGELLRATQRERR